MAAISYVELDPAPPVTTALSEISHEAVAAVEANFVLGWFDEDLREPVEEHEWREIISETSSKLFPEALVGLQVCAGYAVVDTGAQHCVCGKPEYDKLCERLSVHCLSMVLNLM